ncbi:MAG: Fe2+-dependent dioxygenase [Chromatocurvus sp.]
MILHLSQVLSAADLMAVREAAGDACFADGRQTAGRAAAAVKHNEQGAGPAVDGALALVEKRLMASELFRQAARPASFARLLLSRYSQGMHYGSHVDSPVMAGRRADVSFTLFLSEPDRFQGGELVIEDASGERAWKLDAGDLLLYPSTYLHRVNPVEDGERLAIVGWVTSRVRLAHHRELLFELAAAMHEEFGHRGKTALYDRLSRIHNNLLREWMD